MAQMMAAKMAPKPMQPAMQAAAPAMMKKGGATKKMAAGGSVDTGNSKSMGKVRHAAPSKDGIASKGKTKGTIIKMAGSNKGMKKGGMC